MDVIDPLGLNDYHIARHPVGGRGYGWVGHELGDGRYVLDHKPDLLLLANFKSDPLFGADQQLLADPRFASHYQLIHFDAGPPNPIRAGIYIRRTDGKLGIVRSDDHASVPAYLAAINDANSVRLVNGQAQLVIAPHASAQFQAIPLGDKGWKATLLGSGAAQLTVHPALADVACASCVRPDANGSGALTVENTSNQPATLASIRLEKDGGK